MKRLVSTYSIVFVGYQVKYGIQEILFQCHDRLEAERKCKVFRTKVRGPIYLDESFTIHKMYKYQ